MAILVDIIDIGGGTYTPTTTIGQNTRVELCIDKMTNKLRAADGSTLQAGKGKDRWKKLVFYTEATPMYASVDYILLKAGEWLEEIPEAAIYMMGFTASTLIDDMLLWDPDEKFKNKTDTQAYKFFVRARAEWASCMAILRLLRGLITHRGTNATRKILADFSVDTGAMSNILQSARPWIKDLTAECEGWKRAVYTGGAADYMSVSPLAAVKSGSNSYSNAIGIGRGWEVGGYTLNRREAAVSQGNSWSRPVRYSHPKYYTSIDYLYR